MTTLITQEQVARLTEHAPDLAGALNDLLAWAAIMGGWQAPCWERARCVLGLATGSSEPHASEPIHSAAETVEEAGRDEGWSDRTKLLLLLDFLDAEAARNPVVAGRLRRHLREAADA